MKFTPNDYSILSGAIKRQLNLYTMKEIDSSRNTFRNNPKINSHYIAFIWAVFHKVRRHDQTINDLIHERSSNGTYNDSHIETALKKIFKEYGIKD